MTETRHWIKTLVVTGLLGSPLQGYADVGGEGPAVPPQDGSISKTVLHAGQEVENLLKPTAWQAIEEGYRREVSVFSCDNGAASVLDSCRHAAIKGCDLGLEGSTHSANSACRPRLCHE